MRVEKEMFQVQQWYKASCRLSGWIGIGSVVSVTADSKVMTNRSDRSQLIWMTLEHSLRLPPKTSRASVTVENSGSQTLDYKKRSSAPFVWGYWFPHVSGILPLTWRKRL